MEDSVKLVFNLRNLSEYIDPSSFRSYIIALNDNKLAISTQRCLIITNGSYSMLENSDQWDSPIQTCIEYDQQIQRASAMKWLSSEIVCIGFESGTLACFHIDGLVAIL